MLGVLLMGCGGHATASAHGESGGAGTAGSAGAGADVGSPPGVAGTGPDLETSSGCVDGRQVAFVHDGSAQIGDLSDFNNRVAVDGDRGFLVFGPYQESLLRFSPQGDLVDALPIPYDPRAQPTHGQAAADGSLLMAGWLRDGGPARAWFAKLDADRQLAWENQLDLGPIDIQRADIEPLEDGGAVVAGARSPDALSNTDKSDDDVFVARLASDGSLLWQRQFSFRGTFRFSGEQGRRMLAVDARGIHLAVATGPALFLIGVNLDGVVDEQTISVPVPDFVPSDYDLINVEALPNGELAIYSSHRLAILAVDGSIRVERNLGKDKWTYAARFDAARNQLVIAGSINANEGSAAWVRAINLDGEVAWEMRTEALTTEQVYNLEGAEEGGQEKGDQGGTAALLPCTTQPSTVAETCCSLLIAATAWSTPGLAPLSARTEQR